MSGDGTDAGLFDRPDDNGPREWLVGLDADTPLGRVVEIGKLIEAPAGVTIVEPAGRTAFVIHCRAEDAEWVANAFDEVTGVQPNGGVEAI